MRRNSLRVLHIALIECGVAQLLRKGGLSSNLGFKRSSPAAYCLKIWRESDWQHFLVMHILYLTTCNVHCCVTEEFAKKLLRGTCACIRRVKWRRDTAYLQCKMYSIAPPRLHKCELGGEKQLNSGILTEASSPLLPPATHPFHTPGGGRGEGGGGAQCLLPSTKGDRKL
jgi:hypothetical protein